jgi:murein L,D-transpeptidase YafK
MFCTAWLWAAAAEQDAWVLVDTRSLTLDLMRGDESVVQFSPVSIGRGGRSKDKVKGDQTTPLGQYRVAWFNAKSRFHFFIGLDYPRREQVERAFRQGRLDRKERDRLLDALYHGKLPPQDSKLGGYIGIHGLGVADPQLHEMTNWTEGCVALTDEQIERLREHVKIGTPVVIR